MRGTTARGKIQRRRAPRMTGDARTRWAKNATASWTRTVAPMTAAIAAMTPSKRGA